MVKSCIKVIKSSSQCKTIGRLLNYKDLFYDEIRINEGHVEIYAHGRKCYGRCPICGAKSHSVHSSVAGRPIFGDLRHYRAPPATLLGPTCNTTGPFLPSVRTGPYVFSLQVSLVPCAPAPCLLVAICMIMNRLREINKKNYLIEFT